MQVLDSIVDSLVKHDQLHDQTSLVSNYSSQHALPSLDRSSWLLGSMQLYEQRIKTIDDTQALLSQWFQTDLFLR
jgi:hypothetical protein